jgi:hypothetical protein
MKPYRALDGANHLLFDIGWYCLGVLAIVISMGSLILSLVVIYAIIHPASAQDDSHGWVIGLCVDDQFKITTCRRIGGVLPDEKLCRTVANSIARELAIGRVHCTKVLVDDE